MLSIPLLSLLVAILTCIKLYFLLEGGGGYRHPQARTTRPPCQLQTDQPPGGLGKLEKILKLPCDHLLGKGLIIDEQFGFRSHSCPQQVLRLVEYVSEALETETCTVAVFFDVKAFDRQTDISHLDERSLDKASYQSRSSSGSPSLLCCTHLHKRYTATVIVWRPTRVIRGRYRSLEIGIGAPDSPSSPQRVDRARSMVPEVEDRSKPDKSAAIQFKTVMTYASPVFAHAAQKHYMDYRYTDNSVEPQRMHIAILRHRGSHPNALARRLTINRRILHLIRRPRTYLPIHLTLLQRQLKYNDVNDTHD
ncbi:hypothetical protein EVAR_25844_1 [Eumeta japonica]|uniref:RNA-directed DNA polymerase from transposon BS n=1 Tax=Eumeta variegata TaxID=151549 RepID=A0A4C1VWK9_EUMVA|nr:hypothetical protein EVAR_25844_1 [Eumeta japonica]